MLFYLLDFVCMNAHQHAQCGLYFNVCASNCIQPAEFPLSLKLCQQVPTREFRTQGAMQSDAYTLEEDRSNDPDKSLQFIFEEYPVLQLVGTPKKIQSNL